jgi:hypothetical protein
MAKKYIRDDRPRSSSSATKIIEEQVKEFGL